MSASRSKPGECDELRVPHHADGLRLDKCLSLCFPDESRVFLQRCIRDGFVTHNGQQARQSARVSTNDLLRIEWPDEPAPYQLEAEPVPFQILAEDEHVLVINKPPGVVVHPAKGNLSGTLVHGLLFHDEEAFSDMAEEDDLRPGIVHRLDKDTSGVMVVARTLDARYRLKRAFRTRSVEKTYLALVLGEFGTVTGRIVNRIGRHPRHRIKMAVVPEGGKRAVTNYRVLGTAEGISLVEVHIETGRTHQIRVHFADLNHPVLGDPLYGGQPKDAPLKASRQMLHAWKLVFPHPETGVMRQYMAPLPDDFQDALAQLGFNPIGPRSGPASAQPGPA